MRKALTFWLCIVILGGAAGASRQATSDEARAGTWSGTWEGEGATGGFELTLEKGKEGPLTGRVSVTGEPTYKATLKTLTIEGNKLTASYDFTPAPEAEVVLAATFDGNACKGTWVLREKATSTTAAQGTWSVARKQAQ
jgi:hypothetical protein